MPGRPCEDDQVGLLQAAHHAVEIIKAGGDAGKLSIALEGVRGHVDGRGERLREAAGNRRRTGRFRLAHRACARHLRSGRAGKSRQDASKATFTMSSPTWISARRTDRS